MIKYKKLQDIDWLSREIVGKPLRQIAEEQKCSYSALTYIIKKYKLVVPKRSTRRKSATRWDTYRKTMTEKYPNGRFGSAASNWKGGKRITSGGHIYSYAPNHPHTTKDGYVMEHRLVMETSLGRFLKDTEIVHHINGDKKDNRIENLHLHESRSDHVKMHFAAVKEVIRLKKILDENGISY